MNRRESLFGAGAVLLAAAQTPALAQGMAHDHGHMHHGAPLQSLQLAAADCVVKGQACLAHCLVLLADGDKAMAACAKTVNQVLAMCTALQALAGQQSTLVPALAKVTLEACEICEKECRKHEKHTECKACAESCIACAKECKKVVI